MPTYQRLGRLPRKRHVQFRENGTLLTEEVMGLEGFSGNESILYHLHSPCRVKDVAEFEPIERDEWVPEGHAHRRRAAVRRARDEGIPFALIARRVGLSRERVRQLYAGPLTSEGSLP